MQDTSKYLIHADIKADGVVERSDVVGAIFGQTEGLLGDGLDLRDLQEASKVGRIDVGIESTEGTSFGEVTIASGLDRVETAILAAALETLDRIGPCRATLTVSDIEDVRAAKRREIVDRATALLNESFEGQVSSEDIVEEVRQAIRVEDITTYEGYPAGPRVADSDAIIVVEGRADVLTLLGCGVKTAVAVEGTDVPEEIAALTRSRTVTAFLDGDRGGELIRRELDQVGDVDYVAWAPEGRAVEDLDRREVMAALREKVPLAESPTDAEPAAHAPDSAKDTGMSVGGERPVSDDGREAIEGEPVGVGQDGGETVAQASGGGAERGQEEVGSGPDRGAASAGEDAVGGGSEGQVSEGPSGHADNGAQTLRGHVRAVVEGGTERARLLDEAFEPVEEAPAAEAFELVEGAADSPTALVIDGTLTQRLLDVSAQRGLEEIVAAAEGDFVKKPAGVRVRTAERLMADGQ